MKKFISDYREIIVIYTIYGVICIGGILGIAHTYGTLAAAGIKF